MATIFSVLPVDVTLRSADAVSAISGDPIGSQRSVPGATQQLFLNFVATVLPDASWQAIKSNPANLPFLGYLLGG